MKMEMVRVDRLKRINGNRHTDESHIAKLKASINKENLLHLSPIRINKHMEIIDGQHRVEACKELGVAEVPCIKYEFDVELSQIQTINALGRGWRLEDYANSFASQGITDYQIYVDFQERSKLCSGICLAVLGGRVDASVGGSARASFITGKFKVKTKRFAEQYLNLIEDFKFYKRWNVRIFQQALIVLFQHKDYDHSRMLRKLKAKALELSNTKDGYIKQLEEIYNYHEKNSERIRLV